MPLCIVVQMSYKFFCFFILNQAIFYDVDSNSQKVKGLLFLVWCKQPWHTHVTILPIKSHVTRARVSHDFLHEFLAFLETFNQFTHSIQSNYASLSNSMIKRDHLNEVVTKWSWSGNEVVTKW